MSTTTPNSRRTQATEQFERGKAAVCAVFDAVDHLRATLITISISSTGPDPLRAASDVAEAIPALTAAVTALNAAAERAAAFASKADLAAHADTRTVLLFPRRAPLPTAQPADGTARDDDSCSLVDAGHE